MMERDVPGVPSIKDYEGFDGSSVGVGVGALAGCSSDGVGVSAIFD